MLRMSSEICWRQTDTRIRNNSYHPCNERDRYNETLTRLAVVAGHSMVHTQKTQMRTTVTENQEATPSHPAPKPQKDETPNQLETNRQQDAKQHTPSTAAKKGKGE
ncbi:hypothetical protein J4Q44_G00211620 [Coregonus suidteri]|uniref:Uncharacterized protein n=1 Tax=Coregonus suidteri TaxID=861788 RepID=A0AAN8LTJ0_9TELE